MLSKIISKSNILKNVRSISIFFIDKGEKKECIGKEGETLLRVGLDNNIPLDGACGGCQSCSTCHVYVDKDYLEDINLPDENEEDILDMVDNLKDNSRLACAIKVTNDLEGIILELPELTTNLQD
tara:strand:+ start:92 stop:466 length:375 start_codon:yes stop_codon:yes gene_type:complete